MPEPDHDDIRPTTSVFRSKDPRAASGPGTKVLPLVRTPPSKRPRAVVVISALVVGLIGIFFAIVSLAPPSAESMGDTMELQRRADKFEAQNQNLTITINQMNVRITKMEAAQQEQLRALRSIQQFIKDSSNAGRPKEEPVHH
jgi:predicted PurR-regulated permease PerM